MEIAQDEKKMAFPEAMDLKSQAALVYGILMGDYDRRKLPKGAAWIENLLAKGAPGERMYRAMMDASDRLAERLHPGRGGEGDTDAEILFSNGLDLCEYVGLLMYQYGAYYARHPEDFPGQR